MEKKTEEKKKRITTRYWSINGACTNNYYNNTYTKKNWSWI